MHVKLTCEYIGTGLSGFQAQVPGSAQAQAPNPTPQKSANSAPRTVQGELEAALTRWFGTPIKVVGSGRTDAGVHATGQIISFLLPDSHGKLLASPNTSAPFLYKMTAGVNAFLPPDISVSNPELKEKFNARQEAKAKAYIYKCYCSPHRSATRDQAYHQIYTKPDLEKLRAAASFLTGTHDFTSFCTDLGDKTPVRTIYEFTVTEQGDELWFTVRGSGFLKNQVRIMVGTLLAVTEGKLAPADIEKILAAKNRRAAGPTAPAKGLTLFSVEY